MNQALCMYPAQGVLKNVELSRIIAHDNQIVAKTMLQHATEQRPFGGNANMSLACDVHRVQTLKPGGVILELITCTGT